MSKLHVALTTPHNCLQLKIQALRSLQVASMILDGRQLEFYKYNGDYKPYLEDVRDRLNEVASAWSRDQKDHCLGETEQSFRVCCLPSLSEQDIDIHFGRMSVDVTLGRRNG